MDSAGEAVSSSIRQSAIPDRMTSLETIEVLLDFAICEGERLELPFVVQLLRMARKEMDCTSAQDKNRALGEEAQ
jgi:hypothetical protein